MMTDKTNFLYIGNFDLFKALPQSLVETISQQMSQCVFPKEGLIYLPDDRSETLYFLKQGKVKIANYSEEGREVIKTILQPGEVFGELALFEEGRRNDFAQAMEAVTVCKILKRDFENLMAKYPNFSFKVNKLIGFRLLKIEKRFESLAIRDARTRIIELLTDYAEEKGQKVGYEVIVQVNLTHQDMANLVATSRQTVTSVLSELKKQNLIHISRQQILIRDLAKLKQAGWSLSGDSQQL
jgi:CRP/FNR family cyclic AMP-dependent transcriptional regulator